MNTPSPDREGTVPSVFTEAQIQGAYMFACQEIFQELVRRYGVKRDATIPDAITISGMNLSRP